MTDEALKIESSPIEQFIESLANIFMQYPNFRFAATSEYITFYYGDYQHQIPRPENLSVAQLMAAFMAPKEEPANTDVGPLKEDLSNLDG